MVGRGSEVRQCWVKRQHDGNSENDQGDDRTHRNLWGRKKKELLNSHIQMNKPISSFLSSRKN